MLKRSVLLILLLATFSVGWAQNQVLLSKVPPVVDGNGNDAIWAKVPWQPIDHLWLGKPIKAQDFQGRFKLLATAKELYVLAEIVDDSLIDIHKEPTDHYWDDDCLEIFIDPDASGGNHQYNHQAFAYHLSIANNAIDLDSNQRPISLAKHVHYKRITKGYTSIWEVAVQFHDSTFSSKRPNQKPMVLAPNQIFGFGIAYCDNDTSPDRENFIGSFPIPGPDTNRGWIDASLFTKMTLKR